VIPALLAVVLGIIVASVVDEPSTGQLVHVHRARGVGWALLSAISFGWVFFVLGPCSVTLGPAWTLAIMRAVAIVLLLALAKPMRSRLTAALRSKKEQSSSHVRTLVVACLDSTGMVLFTFGTSHEAIAGEIAVVAVLTSSFPLVALALARVYLRERLRWWQWLGVAAVLVGVVWISATY
jgi:drug/metabolite transporter (DMT)-like permease